MGGDRRGGSATRAGEPEAEQPGNTPEAGGSADLSSATATGGSPQSPQDRQVPAAAAAALAFAFALAFGIVVGTDAALDSDRALGTFGAGGSDA